MALLFHTSLSSLAQRSVGCSSHSLAVGAAACSSLKQQRRSCPAHQHPCPPQQHYVCAQPLAVQRPPAARLPPCHAFSSGMEDLDGGDQLASEFAAHINQLALKAPLQHRRPSPLEPPTAAVAAQMDALQINDWPEPDAGVHTALAFAKPYQCEDLVTAAPLQGGVDTPALPLPSPRFSKRGSSSNGSKAGGSSSKASSSGTSSGSNDGSSSSGSGSGGGKGSGEQQQLVRSWSAREAWLTPQEFAAELHSSTYAPLLGCDSWRACSTMVFPPTRVGHRAVQAVEVLANSRAAAAAAAAKTPPNGSNSSSSNGGKDHLQRFTYTFVLERITSGPYRDCWLTVGVRPGNYAV